MKYILGLLLAITCTISVKAQDTLRKVLEYDIKIADASKVNVPELQQYIAKAGNENWVLKLLQAIYGPADGFRRASSTR
ncbi:MAG: hypothetical protein SFW35_10575 [Chitinophagales bacterium]|nr:hypothetical protein [Chitinophagales bacterium]